MIKTLSAIALLSLALPLGAQERPAKPANAAKPKPGESAKPANVATAANAAIGPAAAKAPGPSPSQAAGEPAADRADLDRTAIVGNRELPKVLYIVPWKKPLPATLSGRPVASVIDEALAPIDRDVFRRHLAYDAQLSHKPGVPATPVTPVTPAPEPPK